MKHLKIFTFFCLLAQVCSIILETKLGKIEGAVSESLNGKPFSSFLGIHYAKQPVGSLRFKKPQLAEPWTGVLQANTNTICIQKDNVFQHSLFGVEECLELNIYTPKTTQADDAKLYPVMFFIHGGAFYVGSGTQFYGPERFMDYGVVLVTINYRLGPLGFMTTNTDDMPANLGLWDQNFALQWVQKNIKDYGGDPNKVTIFGESAGSMSVMCQYLSPKSKNLFHGAIAQSGVASSSLMKLNKNPVYYVRSLADRVGCNPEATTKDLVSCLQKVDAVKITEQTDMLTQIDFFPLPFKPVIDDFSADPFLPKDPLEIIEAGEFNDVPLIIGNNNNEGLMSAIGFYTNQTRLNELGERWENELGPVYLFGREKDEVDKDMLEIMKEVNKFAFPNEAGPTTDNLMTGFKEAVGDTVFNAVGSVTARKIAEKSKSGVYEYLNKHIGTIVFQELSVLPIWKIMLKYFGQFVGLNLFRPSLGVGHADELGMMFKIPFLETVFTDEDKATSKNFLQLWTDFAKTGNPTPQSEKWKKLSKDNKERLEIGSGTLEMHLDEAKEKRIEFWTKIWKRVPLQLRSKTSESWKNPLLYSPLVKPSNKKNNEEL